MPGSIQNRVLTPLIAPKTKPRVRLPAHIFECLDWGEFGPKFDCLGYFRREGELFCAPKSLKTASGSKHPFQRFVDQVQDISTLEIDDIENIPELAYIAAQYRLIQFEAAVTNLQGNQLELKFPAHIRARLGWTKLSPNPIYPMCIGRILVLVSARWFERLDKDLPPFELEDLQ